MIKPTALLERRDMFVMFDGCPTCKRQSAVYLMTCHVYAQQMGRRLRIVSSGSPTARGIRAIAKDQGVTVRYPIILLDGLFYFEPQDISLDDYLVDDDEPEEEEEPNEE
ncbi:MAG: Thioredoxin domain protein [Moriyavirus koyama]|uniref:Thioredoxin domain protein n=1 Tax=Bacteriophage sp. TaxID=38018 RepID=A0ABY5TVE9_9VIRU|nr:MAG: Thioredoxin domain protein [Bacteriophage sp.]